MLCSPLNENINTSTLKDYFLKIPTGRWGIHFTCERTKHRKENSGKHKKILPLMKKKVSSLRHNLKQSQKGTEQNSTYIYIYMWLKQHGQGKIQRADLLFLEPQEPGSFQCVHAIGNTDLKSMTKRSTSESNTHFSYFCSSDHQWIQTGRSWQRPVGLCHLWPCESLAGCIPYAERASVHFRGFLEGKAKVKYLWETLLSATHHGLFRLEAAL